MLDRLPAILLCLLLTACDAAIPDVELPPRCPAPLAPGQVAYLPLAVGDVHAFSYEHIFYDRDASQYVAQAAGTLTLTVEAADCADGERTYSVREEIEGDGTGGLFSRMRTVAFVETDTHVRTPYADGAHSRAGPSPELQPEHPPILLYVADSGPCLYHCPGPVGLTQLAVRKGGGLLSIAQAFDVGARRSASVEVRRLTGAGP